MLFSVRLLSSIAVCTLLLGALSLGAQTSASPRSPAGPPAPAILAVRSFYTFHLAHNKDFTARSIQQRKRFLTPELYGLLMNEIKRQAAYGKEHPDEVPDIEGDPLTDSQDYPNSFRVGKADVGGDVAKVTVTFIWGAGTSRGRDKRDIVVEVTKSGQSWLISDIINSEGTSLRADLKKQR